MINEYNKKKKIISFQVMINSSRSNGASITSVDNGAADHYSNYMLLNIFN